MTAMTEEQRKKKKITNAAWYKANKEKSNAASTAWKAANPKRVKEASTSEKKRAAGRAWKAVNKEKGAAVTAAWNTANPERRKALSIAWRVEHPEKSRAVEARRRALKLSAQGTHTAQNISVLYESQGGQCAYCGVLVGDSYHVDHVVPLSRGGSNAPDNLAISCPGCNTSKGAKTLEEWRPGTSFAKR